MTFDGDSRRAPARLGWLAAIAAGIAGFFGTWPAFAQDEPLVGQPTPWGLGFQPGVTEVAHRIDAFHNLLLVIITLITLLVLGLLIYVAMKFRATKNPTPSKTTHNTTLEVVWTAGPIAIVFFIIWQSMDLLYFIDEVPEPEVVVEVRGYQWNWGYSYPDQQIREYRSVMLRETSPGWTDDSVRLLSTDNPMVIPVDTNVQFLVSAGDVLHAFAMPAFGVKIDAVPGRTNQTWAHVEETGTYYGQCSQICGRDHAFMPIEIEVVSREDFDAWVLDQVGEVDPEDPPLLLTGTYEEVMARRQIAQLD